MTAIHDSDRLDGARLTRRAWWSVAGLLPSLVLAFLVGEGLISALGYPSGGVEQAPWWAALTAAVPAIVVFALPAALAAYFGTRAQRLGDPRGRVPVLVALVVAGSFVATNGLSAALIWLS